MTSKPSFLIPRLRWFLLLLLGMTAIAACFFVLTLSGAANKCGYIDKTGKTIISISGLSDGGEFNEGLAPAKIERGWGYINKKGEWVIPPQFKNARSFSEGLAAVQLSRKRFAFIGSDAKAALEFEADAAGDFHEGLALVAKNGKCGYINRRGIFVIPQDYIFDGYHYSSDGAIPVKIKTDKPGDPSWILIDQLNHPIFKSKFYGATEAGDKLAAICIALKNEPPPGSDPKIKGQPVTGSVESTETVKAPKLRWGYIDTNGNYALQPQYLNASTFSEGYASVAIANPNNPDSKCAYTYIDQKGNPLQLQLKTAGKFSEGLAAVCKADAFGYIDNTGKFVIPAKFSRADRFAEGLAFTKF